MESSEVGVAVMSEVGDDVVVSPFPLFPPFGDGLFPFFPTFEEESLLVDTCSSLCEIAASSEPNTLQTMRNKEASSKTCLIPIMFQVFFFVGER